MEDGHSAATVHAAITALSVSVGRLEERMGSLHAALGHHMKEEHQAFNDALEEVKEIRSEVAKLQSIYDQGRGAWWALLKVGGALALVLGALAWLAEQVMAK